MSAALDADDWSRDIAERIRAELTEVPRDIPSEMPQGRESASARAIIFRPIHEVISTDSQVKWLLRGIIEQRVILLVAGRRGSYKSFIVLDWSMTLAVRGVPVFMVSAEGAGLAQRVEAWLKVHAPNVDPVSLPLYVHERRIDFSDRSAVAAVRTAIAAAGMTPEVLVIDTFSKNSGSLDENSNTEVKNFIGRLDVELRTPMGLAIILVAHTGHGDQTHARGASALEADTDAALIVSRKGNDQVVRVDRNRFKDAPEMPPLVYHAEVIDLGRHDDEGKPVTSLVMREADEETSQARKREAPRGKAQQKILSALVILRAESSVPLAWTLEELREIGRNLGLVKGTARSAVEGLIEKRYLNGAESAYRLADGVA